MNEETLTAYPNKVLEEAISRYGVGAQSLTNLNGNESFVYSFAVNGQEYVLKIIHHSRRTLEQVLAEVEWLQFLSKQGLSVSLPVPSLNGLFVERIKSGSSYFAVIAYHKAKGKLITQKQFTPQLLEQWGRMMGRMHTVSKRYKKRNLVYQRPEWHQSPYMDVQKWVPSTYKALIETFNKLYDKLIHLPKSIQDYGLVHSDLHHQNFLVEGDHMTVIDFDDAEYYWFIGDIAKVLYNESFNFSVKPQQRHEFALYFLEHFMSGYGQENQLDPTWYSNFAEFVEFRHLFVLIRKFEALQRDALTSMEKVVLDKYCHELERSIPLLKIDYEQILTEKSYAKVVGQSK